MVRWRTRDFMKKTSFLKNLTGRILNLLLWLITCALAGTGLLMALRLPPGSRGGRGLSALGMTRHEWGDVHTWLSYVFLVLVFLHLAVHWRWLWQFASRRRALPVIAGIGVGLGLCLALLLLPVSRREGGGGRHGAAAPARPPSSFQASPGEGRASP